MLNYFKIISIFSIIIFIAGCGSKFGDARKTPTNALERARKNVEEGRGAGLGRRAPQRCGDHRGNSFASGRPVQPPRFPQRPSTSGDHASATVGTAWEGKLHA